MSYDGMAGLETSLDDVSGLLGSVSDGEWDYPSAARVESATRAFTAWATTRLPLRDHATVTGDEHAAATFLDALNLV
jgi:hypothetical protein